MSLIQPYMVQDFRLWMQDLWNKLKGTQSQVNSGLQVVGLAFQNNTPVGGQISWSACTVYYNGTAYPIAAGTSGTNALVWWNVGDASFTSGASFTPSPTTFPILTNVAGTADLTWFKVGANSIQQSQVIGGLLPPGYQIQIPASSAFTTGGTLLTYTGGGALLSIGFLGGQNLVSTGGAVISVSADGQAAINIPLTVGSNPAVDVWDGHAIGSAINGSGTTGALLILGYYIPFKTSLSITLNITGYISGGGTAIVNWAKSTP